MNADLAVILGLKKKGSGLIQCSAPPVKSGTIRKSSEKKIIAREWNFYQDCRKQISHMFQVIHFGEKITI